jgi:hypothetical protein
MERRPPAAGDDHFESRVKRGQEQGVVATQRVPDNSQSVGIHIVASDQQIDGSHVIENPFHRAAA